jgi:hypothetical protein
MEIPNVEWCQFQIEIPTSADSFVFTQPEEHMALLSSKFAGVRAGGAPTASFGARQERVERSCGCG